VRTAGVPPPPTLRTLLKIPGKIAENRVLARMKTSILFLLAAVAPAQITFPPDLTISRIEVVQTVQDETQEVPLIAGKATVARAFVRQLNRPEALVSGVTVFLRAYRNGVEIAQSPLRSITPAIQARPAPDRGNLLHAQTFVLPDNWTAAGTLELRAELRIPPGTVESPTDNNNLTRAVAFVSPHVLDPRIAWLPLCSGGTCYGSASRGPAASQALIERLLPVPESTLRYDDVPVPAVRWDRPLADAAGITAFQSFLKKWKYLLDDSPLRPHLLAAWLPRSAQTELAGANSSGATSNGVGWLVEQPDEIANQNLLARSLGRALGLQAADGGCTAAAGDPGFDPLTTRLIPATQPSFLASCDNPAVQAWISASQARSLFEALKPATVAPASDYVIVGGRARAIDTAMVVNSLIAPEASVAGGDTCVRVIGSEGEAEQCFFVEETLHFAAKVRIPGRLIRIALRRGGFEVASLSPTGVTPQVAFDAPAAGDTWSDNQVIRWSASDPSNRPLTYTLLYSNDEGANWYPLAVDLTEPRYEIDTAALVGPEVQFRVIASAGLDQNTAGSPTVTLAQTPSLDLPSATVDFGNVVAGVLVERALAIGNAGTGPLVLDAVDNTGEAFRPGTPLPFRVRAGQQRPFPVRHRPRIPGLDTAEALLRSNDPAATERKVTLKAAVFDQPVPTGVLAPPLLDFGTVPVGESRELTARLRNDGSAPLTVFSLSTQNARFSVVSPLGQLTLQPADERTVVVRFTPLADGAQSGALNASTNDPTTPTLRAELRGAGQLLSAPRLELSPTSLDFGGVALGQLRVLSVTARNAGSGPLSLISFTFTNNAYAAVSPATPVSIAPGAQQVLSIRYQPTALGAQPATLTIETNDPSLARATVALQGTGLAAAPSLAPRVSHLIPGSMTPGSPRFNLTVTGANFNSASVVRLNGSDRPTTFLSSTQLRASIAPEDVATARTAQISVVNAPPGGGTSNSVPLVVNEAGPGARIQWMDTSVCPSLVAQTTVFDRIGAPITELNSNNLRCSEDGVPVSCVATRAEPSGSGLSLVMVLHASAGINDPVKQRNDTLNMRNAAYAFIDAIGDQDRMAVTQMDNGVRLLWNFASGENREALRDGVDMMRSPLGIGTSLYDAIEDGLDRLATEGNRRKAMLIFAGNENTYDTRGPRDGDALNALFRRVQNSGVSLHFMPLGDGFRNTNLIALANQFALDSGGLVFTDPNVAATTSVTRLAETLNRQHLIHYATPNRDGQPHMFRVDFTVPGASFTAARGYAGCRP
jgi:hypothetical protein